ncbi:hypothetical protein N9140_00250 [bacterium]|nr:hypothetical protein [bacterium]
MVVRDMIEFSILVGLLDGSAIPPPPPLATTNDEEDEALFATSVEVENELEYCCCPLLPVLMKNKALNAIANVTNFCLNCSLLVLLLLVCRVALRDDDILFEILVIVDRTLPRIFDILFLP